MRVEECKDVIVRKYVTVKVICDVCEKEHNEDENKEWHHFNTHHFSWGNDSVDSYEYYDVCSSDCYYEQLRLCYDICDYDTAVIDGFTREFVKKLLD